MTNNEEIKILKLKLELYGVYTREYERLEHRYYEIEQELAMNENTKNAAKNLGVHGDGPYHTAPERLQLEYSSIQSEMNDVMIERTYLGVDDFISSLEPLNYKIVHCVYVNNMTQVKCGIEVGCDRRTVQRRLDKIYNKKMKVVAHALTV